MSKYIQVNLRDCTCQYSPPESRTNKGCSVITLDDAKLLRDNLNTVIHYAESLPEEYFVIAANHYFEPFTIGEYQSFSDALNYAKAKYPGNTLVCNKERLLKIQSSIEALFKE